MAGLFDTVRRGKLNTETFELLTLQKVNQEIMESEDLSDIIESEDENGNHIDDPNEDAADAVDDSAKDSTDEDEYQVSESGSDCSVEGSDVESDDRSVDSDDGSDVDKSEDYSA